jgi:hypothetical protein
MKAIVSRTFKVALIKGLIIFTSNVCPSRFSS